ncbi:hypothetical protein [Aromatoleum petrolei]|uniref:Uncharacterized protein n=1 Tax=Aromatoleum petrolei TaxID=76116 RepID=A0ABX1MKZ3_9RHOO|nr:hypothetical protein [Aromatoleum petrolei]NMF88628.1 hypothetical protein [Aromatoleum petrolei]QTQ34661.1 Uncharacterized protein ToN1_04890 [Aromatoleum petrolei]
MHTSDRSQQNRILVAKVASSYETGMFQCVGWLTAAFKLVSAGACAICAPWAICTAKLYMDMTARRGGRHAMVAVMVLDELGSDDAESR